MSIKNLEYTGLKNQNIVCNDLTVNGDTNINVVNLNSLTVENDIISNNGDLITLNGNVECSLDVVTTTGDIIANNGEIVTLNGGITSLNSITSQTGDLVSNNGSVQCLNGEILTGSQTSTNSAGKILLATGLHQWGVAQSPGINPLNITLNGDAHIGYHMEYSLNMFPQNVSFYIGMRLNNDNGPVYTSRIQQNSNAFYSGNADTECHIFASDTQAVNQISGCLDLWTDRTVNSRVYYINKYCCRPTTNVVDIYDTIGGYTATGNNITSITFDVSTNLHSACSIKFRIYRYQ
jgi:hypothetical protein